ncbi:hypothetical protein M885DRAFT_516548 [Pelagophyceae sp. CCMP2097]|nr:hypothetical protein M885DRAFT_516548 [Pelagophyceae sp. CCMP2097]
MGAEFSTGYMQTTLQPYQDEPLRRVQARHAAFRKRCRSSFANSGAFLTKDDFGAIFGLGHEAAAKHFAFYDRRQRGRCASVEVFASMALISVELEDAKVAFCFGLGDADRDGFLNQVELVLLIDAVCRGVSRLKEIAAPNMALVEAIAEAAFQGFSEDHVAKGRDEGSGSERCISLSGLSLFLKEDVRCRRYLGSLERSESADAGDLYAQQAALLAELAQIDARLDELAAYRRRDGDDAKAYAHERGGDAGRLLLVPMRDIDDPPSSDDEVDDEGVVGDTNGSGDADARAARLARRAWRAAGRRAVADVCAHVDEAAGRAPGQLAAADAPCAQATAHRHGTITGAAHDAAPTEAEAAKAAAAREAEASAEREAAMNSQLERRARRAESRGARAGGDQSRGDIFRRCAMRKAPAAETADAEAALLRHRWDTLRVGADDLAPLDVDEFEDLFEAVAVMIPDEEAVAALKELPSNAVGGYAFHDLVGWWQARKRRNAKVQALSAAWRGQVDACLSVLDGFGAATRRLRGRLALGIEVAAQERASEAERAAQAARALTDGTAALVAAAADNDDDDSDDDASQKGDDMSKGATTAASSTDDDSVAPAVAAWSLTVGKVPTSHAALKFDCFASAVRPPRASPSVDELRDAVEAATEALRRPDVSASELLAYERDRGALERVEDARTAKRGSGSFTGSRGRTSFGSRTSFDDAAAEDAPKKEVKEVLSVVWADLVVEPTVPLKLARRVAREVEAAFRCVPRDHAAAYYARARCDVVSVKRKAMGSAKQRPASAAVALEHVLRVQIFRDDDALDDVERDVASLSKLLGKLSVQCSLSCTLSELFGKFSGYSVVETKVFGAQVDGNAAQNDPRAFRKRLRAQRLSAKGALKEVDAFTAPELKTALERRGLSSAGAFAAAVKGALGGAEARARLAAAALRDAARAGYGDVSTFGASLAKRIFRRFDVDGDGALKYPEFAQLARALGEAPPLDAAEYRKDVGESKYLAAFDSAQPPKLVGLSEAGLVAQYERRGRLAAEAAKLGLGSLDDFVECVVTVTADLDAGAASKLEKLLVARSRALNRGGPDAGNGLFDRLFGAKGGRGFLWPLLLRTFAPRPAAARHRALLELALCCLRFVKGAYFDGTADRLSHLFEPGGAPKWLMQPAGPFFAYFATRSQVADGAQGLVPALRKAVADFFGRAVFEDGRAKWLDDGLQAFDRDHTAADVARDPMGVPKKHLEDEGRIAAALAKTASAHLASALASADADAERQQRDIDDAARLAIEEELREAADYDAAAADEDFARLFTTNAPDDASDDSDGGLGSPVSQLLESSLASSLASPFDSQKFDSQKTSPHEASAKAAERALLEPWRPDYDFVVDTLKQLRLELETLAKELSREKLPRRRRLLLSDLQTWRLREVAALTALLERRTMLAVARGLRAYDAARCILRGPATAGCGNARVTARLDSEHMLGAALLSRLLPPGRGEAATLKALEAQLQAEARARLAAAYMENVDAVAKMASEAAEAASAAADAIRERAEAAHLEEVSLYEKGLDFALSALRSLAKPGKKERAGNVLQADRKQLEAEELWDKLAQLRLLRHGDGSMAFAVAAANVAALVSERAKASGSTLQKQEAIDRARNAAAAGERALLDRLRADAAAGHAAAAAHAVALNLWDAATAKTVVKLAQQAADRGARQRALQAQLEALDPSDVDDRAEALRRSISQKVETLKRDDFYAAAAGAADALERDKPAPPLLASERFDDALICYCVMLSNELRMLEALGPPALHEDDVYREGLYAKAGALYACLGQDARETLQRLNDEFANDRQPALEQRRLSVDSNSGVSQVSQLSRGSGGSLSTLESRRGSASLVLRVAFNVHGVGIQLLGAAPAPHPRDMRARVIAASNDDEAQKLEALRLAALLAATQSKAGRKLLRLRRKMALLTHFTEEELRVLDAVQPKRAKRLRARLARQAEDDVRRGRGEDLEARPKGARSAGLYRSYGSHGLDVPRRNSFNHDDSEFGADSDRDLGKSSLAALFRADGSRALGGGAALRGALEPGYAAAFRSNDNGLGAAAPKRAALGPQKRHNALQREKSATRLSEDHAARHLFDSLTLPPPSPPSARRRGSVDDAPSRRPSPGRARRASGSSFRLPQIWQAAASGDEAASGNEAVRRPSMFRFGSGGARPASADAATEAQSREDELLTERPSRAAPRSRTAEIPSAPGDSSGQDSSDGDGDAAQPRATSAPAVRPPPQDPTPLGGRRR